MLPRYDDPAEEHDALEPWSVLVLTLFWAALCLVVLAPALLVPALLDDVRPKQAETEPPEGLV